MWEQLNYVDCWAFRIVNKLSKRRKLIDIANEMEMRTSIQDPSQAQLDDDMTRNGFFVLQ